MKKLNIISILSVLFLIISVAFSHSQEVEEVGIVTAVQGTVNVTNNTGTENVVEGSAVYIGDLFDTAEASGVKILLDDESLISLGENTSFEINEFIYNPEKRKSISNITKGKIRAILRKIKGSDSNIEFITPNAVAGIKGTILVIHIEDSVFAVKEGVVAVRGTDLDGNEVILRPNQFTKIINGQPQAPSMMTNDMWNNYRDQSDITQTTPYNANISKTTEFTEEEAEVASLPMTELGGITAFPTIPPIDLTSPVSNLVPVNVIVN